MAEDAGAGSTALSFEEHYERIEKKPLGEGTYGEAGAAARWKLKEKLKAHFWKLNEHSPKIKSF